MGNGSDSTDFELSCNAPPTCSSSSFIRDLIQISTTIVVTCIALALYNYRLHRQSDKMYSAQNKRIRMRKQRGRLTTHSIRACASLALDGDEVSGEFLSSIISQLWHHMNIAVSNRIKDTMEPMLKNLKVPLHFVKLDLGDVPIRTENIFIHRVDLKSSSQSSNSNGIANFNNESEHTIEPGEDSGIQIDFDVVWDGNCDVMLQATPLGNLTKSANVTFGVKRIKLAGRMSILLSPLTTEIPVISATQYGFTNPPDIKLDFSGVAQSIAKQFAFVQPAVLSIVHSSLAIKLVLPQRM